MEINSADQIDLVTNEVGPGIETNEVVDEDSARTSVERSSRPITRRQDSVFSIASTFPEHEESKDLFKNIHTILLIFLWVPVFSVRNRRITKVLLWTGISMSVFYQILHLFYSITELLESFPYHSNRSETVFEISYIIAAVLYFSIRAGIYIIFWARRQDIRFILSLLTYSVRNEEATRCKISDIVCWISVLLLFVITTVSTVYVMIFLFVPHEYSCIYLLFRIHTTIMVSCILMVYYSMIHGYQVVFESFLISITNTDITISSTRSKMNSIKKIYERIEHRIGIFIFWIFCMNYIETIRAVIVIPKLDHFDIKDQDSLLLLLGICISVTHFIMIVVVVLKIDSQKRLIAKLFRRFEHAIVKRNTETDIKLLTIDIRNAVDSQFTAWLGSIPINKSVLIFYVINLVVYTKLLFSLIQWLINMDAKMSFFAKMSLK